MKLTGNITSASARPAPRGLIAETANAGDRDCCNLAKRFTPSSAPETVSFCSAVDTVWSLRPHPAKAVDARIVVSTRFRKRIFILQLFHRVYDGMRKRNMQLDFFSIDPNDGNKCVIPEIALHFARLCLAAVHVAKLSLSPSGVEGPVPLHGVGMGCIGLHNADRPRWPQLYAAGSSSKLASSNTSSWSGLGKVLFPFRRARR